jgi:hypothetical protein
MLHFLSNFCPNLLETALIIEPPTRLMAMAELLEKKITTFDNSFAIEPRFAAQAVTREIDEVIILDLLGK